MRLIEIFEDNYNDEIKNDLIDIIITFKFKKIKKVPLIYILKQLEKNGFVTVDKEWLTETLNDGDFSDLIDKIGGDNVFIKDLSKDSDNQDNSNDGDEDDLAAINQSKVRDMANDQLTNDLK